MRKENDAPVTTLFVVNRFQANNRGIAFLANFAAWKSPRNCSIT
jgi:hypothetical protein